MTKRPEMLLWLSDARGVYIPRDFANSFADRAKHVSGVTDETWTILEAGPDAGETGESYWDAWNDVCENAAVTDEHGNKFRVCQDGDCWLIPADMEWNDETGSFDYPDEREEAQTD
jgi:hypothetical protein